VKFTWPRGLKRSTRRMGLPQMVVNELIRLGQSESRDVCAKSTSPLALLFSSCSSAMTSGVDQEAQVWRVVSRALIRPIGQTIKRLDDPCQEQNNRLAKKGLEPEKVSSRMSTAGDFNLLRTVS